MTNFENAEINRYCEGLEELLFKHYLKLEYDIRMCPNSKCKNVGFIDFE